MNKTLNGNGVITRLIETAKANLKTNSSEGQVETDVVLPLLHLLGYTNIEAKPTIATHAGRRVHLNTQADLVAYGDDKNKLPTIVVDAKSPGMRGFQSRILLRYNRMPLVLIFNHERNTLFYLVATQRKYFPLMMMIPCLVLIYNRYFIE